MYQLDNIDDTIVAIATPGGHGGIGIVRLSGPQAFAIADKIFRGRKKRKPSESKTFSVHYGWIVQENQTTEEIVDEVLLTVMKAPQTYTKQDIVEISCHGGTVVLRSIVSLAVEHGARLAEPGEFTKRAFLNGRIDLIQAEAVLDVIQAKTAAFLRVSTNQLKGELSTELESIRDALLEIYVEIEAIVNFPEDDVDAAGRAGLKERIGNARRRMAKLLASGEQGRILKEGIKIVLCGKPNVGKSSLLNVLLKQPRAIVTDIAGTTRDTIEETAQIRGIPFQLVDTAGILEPRDLIEEEAVKRSHLYIESADLVLFVLDAGRPWDREDDTILRHVKGKNVLAVLNKCDLHSEIDDATIRKHFPDEKVKRVSALKKLAIVELEEMIVESVWHAGDVGAHGIMVSNMRHLAALKEGVDHLEGTERGSDEGLSLEFISEDIKAAVNGLDRITGRNVDADLLDEIFTQFCIGK
jgi:tRNA modification GTPase